jgi:hypothetical protein
MVLDNSFHFMFPAPKLDEKEMHNIAVIFSYFNVLQCLWYIRKFAQRLKVVNKIIREEKQRKINSINDYFQNRNQLKPPSDTELRVTYRKRLQNNKP